MTLLMSSLSTHPHPYLSGIVSQALIALIFLAIISDLLNLNDTHSCKVPGWNCRSWIPGFRNSLSMFFRPRQGVVYTSMQDHILLDPRLDSFPPQVVVLNTDNSLLDRFVQQCGKLNIFCFRKKLKSFIFNFIAIMNIAGWRFSMP